ncbi:MAG: alpha/beta fold hydrolase [Planctomycetota bacterium]
MRSDTWFGRPGADGAGSLSRSRRGRVGGRRLREGAVRLALVLGLVFLAGCPQPPPLPEPDELHANLSYAVLQPELTCAELRESYGLEGLPVVDTPAEAGMAYTEHWIPGPEGTTLRAWYIPAPAAAAAASGLAGAALAGAASGRGLALISCGNSGSMACYLFTARLLTERGWSAVLYEYEGFGGSTGVPSLNRLRDDLSTVLDWTLAETGLTEVTLVGISLGSIPSVAVAAVRPEAVNGVILDSPIALGAEISRFASLIGGPTRVREVIARLEPWLLSEAVIGLVQQPLLIFSHEDDPVAPPDSTRLLYDRAAGPKELVYFAGLDHAAGQFLRTETYAAHLEAFLTRVWVSHEAP